MAVTSLSDGSLAVFNFLPSRTLHPSRFRHYGCAVYAATIPAMPEFSGTWHRHWSREILRQEGLVEAPVSDIRTAGLAVAVLAPAALEALVQRIGVVLCASRLRYAISGDAVRALRGALGVEVLHWARDGRTLHPGLPGPMFQNAHEAVRTVSTVGYAALYSAFKSAKPEVARRLFLKLPLTADEQRPIDEGNAAEADSKSPVSMYGGPPFGEGGNRATTVEGGELATTHHREETTAMDSETAMALAMALIDNAPARGPE
jgi:type III secretion protein K